MFKLVTKKKKKQIELKSEDFLFKYNKTQVEHNLLIVFSKIACFKITK